MAALREVEAGRGEHWRGWVGREEGRGQRGRGGDMDGGGGGNHDTVGGPSGGRGHHDDAAGRDGGGAPHRGQQREKVEVQMELRQFRLFGAQRHRDRSPSRPH